MKIKIRPSPMICRLVNPADSPLALDFLGMISLDAYVVNKSYVKFGGIYEGISCAAW